MLGYITADQPELRVREFETYNGYYCGLCKAIGESYSQLLRTTLSTDMTFLAIVLSAVRGEEENRNREHCVAHHIAKKLIISNDCVDYAADMMVILGYEDYRDDLRDRARGEKKEETRKKAAAKAFIAPSRRRGYRRALENRRHEAEAVRDALSWVYAAEDAGVRDPDEIADFFADVMRAVFLQAPGGSGSADAPMRRVLSEFAAAVGRWIYLLDAADDLADDLASGAFNPYIAEHGGPARIDEREMRKIALEAAGRLYSQLEDIAKAYELLDLKQNRSLLDNIIYQGMRQKTDATLKHMADKAGWDRLSPLAVPEDAPDDETKPDAPGAPEDEAKTDIPGGPDDEAKPDIPDAPSAPDTSGGGPEKPCESEKTEDPRSKDQPDEHPGSDETATSTGAEAPKRAENMK